MKPAVSPAVWRADEIGGKAGLSRALQESELVALEAMLAATGVLRLLESGPKDFGDPLLEALGRDCRHEIAQGRGVVILTGLDPARFGAEGYQRVYWYLGQLIGTPMLQSERGDRLGTVRQEKDNPFKRGYISNLEIGFHNDYHEILSLACVQTASEGGESGLASSLTVHNMLLDERPDLLATLYEGWLDGLYAFYHLYPPKAQWTDERVPCICAVDDVVTVHGLGTMFNDLVAAERGIEIPDKVQEALSVAQAMAARPGVSARFMLEPGEMSFWHNWSVLHARTEFQNAPGRERQLMRLWMDAHESRPTPEYVRERARTVDRIHAEIGARKALSEAVA